MLVPVALDAVGSNIFNFSNDRTYNYADNNSHITNINTAGSGQSSVRIFNENAVNIEEKITVNQPLTVHDNQNRGNLAITCLDQSCQTPVGLIVENAT